MGPAVIDHLMRDPEPVALFVAYGEPAMQFMEMVDERKLAIPTQIGMAAETEDALNGLVTKVPMTCLVPAYETQGFEAARLLDRMLGGQGGRARPPHLHLRVRPGAAREFQPDCHIRRAGRADARTRAQACLRGHYSPESLAHAYGCSLRMIQIRFHKALRRGVAEIIREQRTQRAAELIRKTALPMKKIIEDCGFSCHHQLERAVRLLHGISPSALRKSHAKGNHANI